MTTTSPESRPVVGDGLVLTRDAHGVVLHTLAGGSARRIGGFTDVRDAWRAVDEIDLLEVDAGIAVAA